VTRSPASLFGGGPFGRRLSRPGAGKVAVTVVTGFLGAGKTTLIRAALKSPEAANSVVIVNEFGEIGIDDVILRTSTEEVRLIENGCMCCAASHDLQRTLRNLYAEREAGTVPPFERVIIETSGLADPGPILQSLHADRALTGHYALDGLVTVVDAALSSRTESSDVVWLEQVVQADCLVVTKTDVPETAAGALGERLAALNPSARLIEADAARATPSAFLGQLVARGGHVYAEHRHRHGHERNYDSFVLRLEQDVDWALFTRALDMLLFSRGEDILRVKGLVAVKGVQGPVVVHYVRHLSSAPEELMSWPDGRRATSLVFVTRNLGRSKIEALFQALLGLED
jgi:G3E family GTPase